MYPIHSRMSAGGSDCSVNGLTGTRLHFRDETGTHTRDEFGASIDNENETFFSFAKCSTLPSLYCRITIISPM